MIEETAIVRAVDGNRIEVETLKKSACGGCSLQHGCGTGLLSRYLSRRAKQKIDIPYDRDMGARVGDRVILGIAPSAVSKGSFVSYIIPLVAMIAMALLAGLLFDLHNDAVTLAGGGIGLILGLRLARYLTGNFSTKADFQPVILRKIP
ncbi:MAG: Fis family transcriptional regulator [Gammaproteobacteria bacterium]|nr:MAG: Fis family transcriptional regulator [Gammaproteobacteria bacterium]